MKIEVGKTYKTRDGSKAKVLLLSTNGSAPWPFIGEVADGRFALWDATGVNSYHDWDLVVEWSEAEPNPGIEVTTYTVTKYRLPDGREFDSREEAEKAHRRTEFAQEIYDNTDVEDHLTAQSVAEFIVNNYTLTPK